MIDGIWWLVILILVVAALWLVAKSRAPNRHEKNSNPQSRSAKTPTSLSLQKTAALIKTHLPNYHVSGKTNHLIISKQDKKIAMITIDKKIPIGQRRLGELPVINYHRVPSRDQLTANLQDAE